MAENPAEKNKRKFRKTLSDWGGVFFVRFSMNKPPAMLVVGIKSFSFK